MFVGTQIVLDTLTLVLIVKFSLYLLQDSLCQSMLEPTSIEEIVCTNSSWRCSL